MLSGSNVAVIIPALNEVESIAQVISALPKWLDDIVVVDNGSTDATASIAGLYNTRVITENRRGYGRACLAGIAALRNADIVVFLDADFSSNPQEMHTLIEPIVNAEQDLVIGSRILGIAEKGALQLAQRIGNWLACTLIHMFWRRKYTDLGPFRAIRYSSLKNLKMKSKDYAWTVEMQIRAIETQLQVAEVPVSYNTRYAGKSKISGTAGGTISAGIRIFQEIFSTGLRRVVFGQKIT